MLMKYIIIWFESTCKNIIWYSISLETIHLRSNIDQGCIEDNMTARNTCMKVANTYNTFSWNQKCFVACVVKNIYELGCCYQGLYELHEVARELYN